MEFGFKKLACMVLLASAAVAGESGVFVGGEAGIYSSKNSYDSPWQDYSPADSGVDSYSWSDRAGEFGFKIGYVFSKNHRGYAGYYKSGTVKDSAEWEASLSKFLVGYDYTPEIAKTWRGVLGLYGGYAKVDMSVDDLSFSVNGTLFGGKLGVIYELGEKSEIEMGIKVERVGLKDKQFVEDAIGTSSIANYTQTNRGIFIGYNYKF